MPAPGVERNPLHELPLRFRARAYVPLELDGETPATMERSLRGLVLAPGIVRHLWYQAVGMIPAASPFSWSGNAPAGGGRLRAFAWTRALRYMAQSYYLPAGSDSSRFGARRDHQPHQTREPRQTLGAGVARNLPTVRNRLTSFGSRVKPLVGRSPAGEEDGS